VRITKIERQKKHPGRKNIYADGKFVAGVSDETLLKLALRTGDEIGAEQLMALQATETVQSAKNTALRFLATRPRTEREIRTKLREKEFSDEEIARVIQDLHQGGLVDDREFSRMYIRNARALRPAGAPVLRRKLLLLGVARPLVDEVLAEELTEADQSETARNLAEHFIARARSTRKGEPPEKLRARLTGYLGRRGFRWETIREAVDRVLKNNE
jgi:regulatory protein